MSLKGSTNGFRILDYESIDEVGGMSKEPYTLKLDGRESKELEKLAEEVDDEKDDIEVFNSVIEVVRDEFRHIGAIARNHPDDKSPEDIDLERRESQSDGSSRVKFSRVLDGSYYGNIAGGCLERAVMTCYMLDEFGYESILRLGEVDFLGEKGLYETEGHAWVETWSGNERYIIDPATSTPVDVFPKKPKNNSESDDTRYMTDLNEIYRDMKFAVSK